MIRGSIDRHCSAVSGERHSAESAGEVPAGGRAAPVDHLFSGNGREVVRTYRCLDGLFEPYVHTHHE
jgi:hypothetical protein